MEHNNFDRLLNRAYTARRAHDDRAAQDRVLRDRMQKAAEAQSEQTRHRQAALRTEASRHAATIRTRAERTAAFLVAQQIDPSMYVPKNLLPLSQRLGLKPRMAGWVALKLNGKTDDNPSRPPGISAVHYDEMCSSRPGVQYYDYPKLLLTTGGDLITLEGESRYIRGLHEATNRELIAPHNSHPSGAVSAWDERFALVVEGNTPSMSEDEWFKMVGRE